MRKTIKREVRLCDLCAKESDWPDVCKLCGKEMCHDCGKIHGREYSHAVYLQGSGDGFYCIPCDQKLTASGTDPLHNAYLVIHALKADLVAWRFNFGERQAAAERAVKALLRREAAKHDVKAFLD